MNDTKTETKLKLFEREKKNLQRALKAAGRAGELVEEIARFKVQVRRCDEHAGQFDKVFRGFSAPSFNPTATVSMPVCDDLFGDHHVRPDKASVNEVRKLMRATEKKPAKKATKKNRTPRR